MLSSQAIGKCGKFLRKVRIFRLVDMEIPSSRRIGKEFLKQRECVFLQTQGTTKVATMVPEPTTVCWVLYSFFSIGTGNEDLPHLQKLFMKTFCEDKHCRYVGPSVWRKFHQFSKKPGVERISI